MAKTTTNLGLYEAEHTDGLNVFNITTMLNDNWDKIDSTVAKKTEIPTIPSSLPANGGNSTTVNNHTAATTPNTTEQTDLIGMVNEVNSTVTSHEAETATESKASHIQIATQAEVTAGTDTTKAVTPKYMKTELDKKENTSNKGIANGYAGLGSDGKVPSGQLPSLSGLERIAEIICTDSALSTVTFSNIPQIYKNLKLIISANTDDATDSTSNLLNGYINGDSTSYYYYNDGSQTTGGVYKIVFGTIGNNYASSAGKQQSVFEILIPDYTNTTKYKLYKSDYASIYGTGSGIKSGKYSGFILQPAAITSLTFFLGNSLHFLKDSKFTLYGVK